MSTPKVENFLDYREYLEEYYKFKKEQNPHFSYRILSGKFSFKSRDFILRVIRGSKNLSQDSSNNVIKGLGLNEIESQYFSTLVKYNQAKSNSERNLYFQLLASLNKHRSSSQILEKDQYEYFSKWYHPLIRSLIDVIGFNGDIRELKSYILPTISTREIAQSIQLLKRLQLIERYEDGTYAITSKTVSTGKEIRGLNISNYHMQTLQLAEKAMDYCDVNDRDFSSLTLGISDKTADEIKEKTRKFRQEILKLAEADKGADRIYQFNLHLYPLTKGN